MAGETVSRVLAAFSVGAGPDDIPASALERARWCVIDLVGAGIAGVRSESGRIMRAWLGDMAGRPQAGVFGARGRFPAEHAACVNGTLAHALELDDVHPRCIGHPGVAVIPAAIAAAELSAFRRRPRSGRDFLEAVVVGYEVMARSGRFVGEGHYETWHPTCTLGSLGAAAAASRLLGLDREQATNALGLAGTMAGGLRQVFVGGTLAKHFHAGRAAENGVRAAVLAQAGLTGPEALYEGPMGFARAFSGVADRAAALCGLDGGPDGDRRLRDGFRFEVEDNEFKLYASCRSAHAPLEAVLTLTGGRRLATADIESIEVGMARFVAEDPAWGCREPETPLAARLSVPYNVAVAALDGEVFLDQFTPERLADPELRDVCRRVKLRPDEVSEGLYPDTTAASVVVKLRDGRRLATRVDYPKGHPRNPVTLPELVTKFQRVAREHPRAEELPALVMGMETPSDLAEFLDALWDVGGEGGDG